ncbi:Hypothetical protein RMHFA_03208a (plasmid) [Roseomonas mucosa]|nr:Hypothetical protein RMHFA_03208a [Roseomonas mucosa]
MASWDEDEGDPDDAVPPWATRRPGPHPPAAAPDPARLLLPLSQAEDLVSRLDARAGAASGAVRQGLVARLALAEASIIVENAKDVSQPDTCLFARHCSDASLHRRPDTRTNSRMITTATTAAMISVTRLPMMPWPARDVADVSRRAALLVT